MCRARPLQPPLSLSRSWWTTSGRCAFPPSLHRRRRRCAASMTSPQHECTSSSPALATTQVLLLPAPWYWGLLGLKGGCCQVSCGLCCINMPRDPDMQGKKLALPLDGVLQAMLFAGMPFSTVHCSKPFQIFHCDPACCLTHIWWSGYGQTYETFHCNHLSHAESALGVSLCSGQIRLETRPTNHRIPHSRI